MEWKRCVCVYAESLIDLERIKACLFFLFKKKIYKYLKCDTALSDHVEALPRHQNVGRYWLEERWDGRWTQAVALLPVESTPILPIPSHPIPSHPMHHLLLHHISPKTEPPPPTPQPPPCLFSVGVGGGGHVFGAPLHMDGDGV